MAEVSIESAVEKLEADTQRVRSEGLEDLRLVLSAGRNGAKIDALRDEGFHKIFESLYRIVRVDKPAFLRQPKSASKNAAASRLTAAASALRLAVDAGSSRIKLKTATSVLDHIIGTVTTPDDDFCEPLRNDYLKSFRTLLGFAAHGEHFRPKQWQTFVDFTLTGISVMLGEDDVDSDVASTRGTSMSSSVSNSLSNRPSQHSGRRVLRNSPSTSLDDLMGALRSLSAVTNAPIQSRSIRIVETVIEFLSQTKRAQEIAIETLNNVAFVLLTEDIGIVRQMMVTLLPILRRLWTGKSQAVRDQILVTLTLCRGFFLSEPGSSTAIDTALKDQLFSTMLSEYASRSSRDMLHLDQVRIQLPAISDYASGLSLCLCPLPDAPGAISTWAALSVMAYLASSISHSPGRREDTVDTEEHPRKRRRLRTQIGDIVVRSLSTDSQEKLSAIQVLFFTYELPNGFPKDVEEEIPQILTNLLDDDPQVASWTMLLISRFASSSGASDSTLHAFWEQAWESGRRAIAATATVRAASILLDSIVRARLLNASMSADLMHESIFPNGAAGPSLLTDATLLLLTDILQSGILERDELFETFAVKVVGWLGLSWTLPIALDRHHNALIASYGHPEYICPLLFALRGAHLHYDVVHMEPMAHPILRAEAYSSESRGFLDYYTGAPSHAGDTRGRSLRVNGREMDPQTYSRLDQAIMDLLFAKIRDFHETWSAMLLRRASNINSDVVAIVSNLCIVAQVSAADFSATSAASRNMSQPLGSLWQSIQDFLSNQKKDSIDNLLILVDSCILQVRDSRSADRHNLAWSCLSLLEPLRDLTKQVLTRQEEEDVHDIDLFDSIETRNSQGSQNNSTGKSQDIDRRDLGGCHYATGSLAYCALSLLIESEIARTRGLFSTEATSKIVDEIVQLDVDDLLSAQGAIFRFLDFETAMNRSDTARLLEHIGETCLQNDRYERCEAVLCFCLKVMTYLVPIWTANEEDDLAAIAFDIYSWYITKALGKNIASPKVLLAMSVMLDATISSNPTYGDGDLPSPRTTTLKILGQAGPGLKYHMAPRLSRLFDRYVLTEHMAIFDDIVENLPSDPDNLEGIAARFHIIAELGSKWHTVLRQATYHLFETAAHVPPMNKLGTTCIKKMCTALGLDSARQLFRLFSPQIFYTWLGAGSISNIPYGAFGYPSLLGLVMDNRIELVAQIALRGSGTHAQDLSELLGSSWDDLLHQAFPRAEAYCLASEISLPQEEKLYHGSESQIRKQLGNDVYVKTMRDGLPSAISVLFIALQDDRGIERALEKAGYTEALSIFQKICGQSKSDLLLPPTQQPSFRAKFLVEEIAYLCSRAEVDMSSLWTPALLIHLYRSLLETAVSALGPLHACSVLRKIRIVLCLGGENALSGYPLETLLHNIRPYLTTFYCSEDAIGIYWYLLENGKNYLQTRLSFLAGLSVSIFASLAGFITSSQDSTTQESHFQSTMSKAQEFRLYLGQYGAEFQATGVTLKAVETFKHLMHCAKSMTGAGNSARSTQEGSVLFALLQDRVSEVPLLTDLHFDLSLSILCKNFTIASDPQDDILLSSEDAARFSSVLQAIIQRLKLNDTFRIWAGHTIGRGFAATGLVEGNSIPNSNRQITSLSDETFTNASSYVGIAKYLSELLWKDDFVTATFAERTLQSISTSLGRQESISLFGSGLDQQVFDDLRYEEFPCPVLESIEPMDRTIVLLEHWDLSNTADSWPTDLVGTLCQQLSNDPVLGILRPFISALPAAAEALLPFAVHLVLLSELNAHRGCRDKISEIFSHVLRTHHSSSHHNSRLVLNTILYLRRCRLPMETTMAQRNSWLEIDFSHAATAAVKCQLWHPALLFTELQQSQLNLQSSRASRRSTGVNAITSSLFTSEVYQKVDDPDFFYGSHQDLDMHSVIQRLSHEAAGYKTVSFQSALFDSVIRSERQRSEISRAALETARALDVANLQGISSAVSSFMVGHSRSHFGRAASGSTLNLHHWDLVHDDKADMDSKNALAVLRTLGSASNKFIMLSSLDSALLRSVNSLADSASTKYNQGKYLVPLSILAQAKHALSLSSKDDFDALLEETASRGHWIHNESFEVVSPLLHGREALFGTIRRNEQLRGMLALSLPESVLLEARTVRQSLQLAQHHDVPQFCLNRAAYLSELSEIAAPLGVNIDATSKYDLSRTFWGQDEGSASIQILQGIRHRNDLASQAIEINRSEILTDLGQKIAEARLEKPDEIINNYLLPAFKELSGHVTGSKSGRVFHNFAAFCDMQLQDSDNRDDFARISKIRERKLAEVQDLEKMVKASEGKHREQLKVHYIKAKTWFKLDDEEWQRVQSNRESLILRCLENYLLSMRACDDFPNDTLRLLSLWLDRSESPKANAIVHKHLTSVPSRKFAPLMNQLSSRILDHKDDFQQILSDLMFRICCDHPYHSLYQIFATSKSKGAKSDDVAASRYSAANKIAELVRQKGSSSNIWISIHNSSIAFVRVAQEKISDKDVKTSSKLLLRKLPHGEKLISTIEGSSTKIPPPTMKIALRADRVYSSIATMAEFDQQVSIAGGVSAPKIATIISSNGARHKMLLKGGNDDLRQDSIMEQVFEEVSNLLKDHRATRQRNLGIRTYKVVPLYPNAGIIEFVQNTMPLHDYLLPAHTRYYPKDYKPNRCRKEISDAQTKPLQQRLHAYRTATANFHPVMRFFFMEHFLDPDDWFYKRLAYSRSTAAISILGHVLGLGDRHGHNILLDENTGEVVHIDLGVAFEAGRVLPVPEVVPFRLTRDLVDGMGVSGVEGVFRRCCNFTLEALRREQESIMTILDVLRYDPLYSWSISPLRLQKMQENNEQVAAGDGAAGGVGVGVNGAGKRDVSEPNEADRALTVVAKKLGKSLSVEATVNELIRQATDERNLAVLYCGWAAYA